jgi:hypothetical protein
MRPSWTKPSGWKPRIPLSQGSCPEYDVSMCPLNMSDLPPPVAVSQRPTTFGRPSSTSCHCTCRPMSSSSSRTRSPIACSSPVGLEIETRSTARRTRRSASTPATVSSALTGAVYEPAPRRRRGPVPPYAKISVVQSPFCSRTSCARAGPPGRSSKSTKNPRSTSIPPAGSQSILSNQERSPG